MTTAHTDAIQLAIDTLGDIMDFEIWHKGQIIDNITGATKAQAQRNARKIYGSKVTVSSTRASQAEIAKAKAESIKRGAA